MAGGRVGERKGVRGRGWEEGGEREGVGGRGRGAAWRVGNGTEGQPQSCFCDQYRCYCRYIQGRAEGWLAPPWLHSAVLQVWCPPLPFHNHLLYLFNAKSSPERFLLAGTEIPGGWGWEGLYLMLHPHRQNDYCISHYALLNITGNAENHFSVSLIVRSKDRQTVSTNHNLWREKRVKEGNRTNIVRLPA